MQFLLLSKKLINNKQMYKKFMSFMHITHNNVCVKKKSILYILMGSYLLIYVLKYNYWFIYFTGFILYTHNLTT